MEYTIGDYKNKPTRVEYDDKVCEAIFSSMKDLHLKHKHTEREKDGIYFVELRNHCNHKYLFRSLAEAHWAIDKQLT